MPLTKQDLKPLSVNEPVVLAVTGMTCAACAARIEKKLNKIDGVSATVNYATSKATVSGVGAATEVDSFIKTIEDLGYGAVAPKLEDGESTAEIATEAHLLDVRHRLIVSAICAVPVMLMSMIRPLQFDGWQWVSLVLALPVALWGAAPFHRSAWRNASHRATTMDTLVSLGVIAAMSWSLWALIFGNAGEIGMKMNMSLFPRSLSGDSSMSGMEMNHVVHDEIYLEVATTLVAFLLAGRYFEVRSRRRAGAERAIAFVNEVGLASDLERDLAALAVERHRNSSIACAGISPARPRNCSRPDPAPRGHRRRCGRARGGVRPPRAPPPPASLPTW